MKEPVDASLVTPACFSHEHHRLRVNLLYTAGWLQGRIRSRLEPHGLSPQQFNALCILRSVHPEPLSTADLRERMFDRSSDTSRLVDRLVARGWVTKAPCCEDRRRVDVTLTDAGLRLVCELDRLTTDLDATTGGLTDAEAAHLNVLLNKLRGT